MSSAQQDTQVMRVIEQQDGPVLILTIDYPARRNALGPGIRAQLEDAIERAQADASIRAIVLTGAGEHFCSGGDISSMNVETVLEGRDRMRRGHRLVQLMAKGTTPIVAAVQGWCAGAGMAIACACDVIVASEDARFMAGFGRIGLMADLGLPHFLPARVGMGRARRILFFHEQVSAPEAERIGLVDYLVPAGHALKGALEKAHFLAEEAPAPIAMTKQILAEGLDAALAEEQHFQASLFTTADHKEGRDAFLGKRKPEFRGS